MKRVPLHKWTLSLFTALSVLGLTACGTQSTSTSPQPETKPAPSTPAATTTASTTETASAKIAGTLSFYTSQPDADAAALIESFTKKYPEVKVELFRSGTEEVISRLQAEAQAGQVKADVLLVADAPTFASLKKQDLLMGYNSPEAADIPADWKDADGAYTGTKVMATVLAINTAKVTTKPDSWKVLTSPETAGKAIMPSPLYSGAAAYNVGVLTRQGDFGWDFITGLKTNQMTVTKGNGAVLKSVAGGEKEYGMVVDYLVARAKKEGSPVELIYPNEGVPVITEPIGILKASKNQDAAKAFVDYVLSEDGQKLASSLGYTPIRKGIAAPEGLLAQDQIKALSANTDELEASREADKKKFGEMMGGK
ncbi:ABC transporter substrate-binding protein [Brevibacillus reuszeri]|uniref:ABC transporter substrate-binding protein n=1 Tax=Brevibacillus reuszeri TaxID=54915 RepID=UPI00289783CD|nr:ABC transporter substrate-binding protein [Brevibacillus reuszeri]